MIDVKCHVRCGLSTITNPCGHRQVDEGIRTKDGGSRREVTDDLGAAGKDVEETGDGFGG